MGENKRYYWLKLKKDFFDSKEMKKLRKLAGGDTFTIIYLKMQLLSLADEGKLYFDGVEDSFAEEIALQIDEDPENVKVTILYLQKVGLVEMQADNELFLPEVPYMTGSETDKAEFMRQKRKKIFKNVTNEGNNVTQMLPDVTKCYTEKEKEIETEIETEIDIDDADGKKKNNKKTSLSKQVEEVIEAYKSICKSYTKIKVISAERKKDIEKSLKTLTVEQIKECFELAEHNYLLKGMIMEGKDGKEPWKASFDWLIQEKNLVKIFNENYAEYDDRVYDINKGDNNNGGTQQNTKGAYDDLPEIGITL